MIVRVFVSGFVQGVGYRQFVKRNALKLGLTGWVKNLRASPLGGPDNRVEAVFAGSKEQLKKIISICEKGPFLSEVKNVMVDWEENPLAGGEEFKDFRVI